MEMARSNMSSGFGRPSLDSNTSSQGTDIIPQTRAATAESFRARSTISPTKRSRPPGSRGSTASIHSSTTHPAQDQHQSHDGYPHPHYMASQSTAASHSFNSNPEELIYRFGEEFYTSMIDPALLGPQTPVQSQTNDPFQGRELRNQTHPPQDVPHELHPHGLPADASMAQYPMMYDTADTQIPDHVMPEIEIPENVPRKRRGTTSTIANDNELRKLLRQYDGYSLQQMAEEVQRHEGSGGKSEKVKQVFAMVWLKENCRKSSGSVRRDKVYCCYADKCGTQRVSVLNPASFGKLVRIIFPNVQTRRLGVRGESKYHYVDLSVIEEKQQPHSSSQPPVKANETASRPPDRAGNAAARQRSITQPPLDTAIFPPPSKSFEQRSPALSNCTCEQSEQPLNLNATPSNLDTQTGKMVFHMLQFPSANDNPAADNDSVELPNIHHYLPSNTDVEAAEGLATLYRTHCISVIDSFRYCKEKNFFRYFSTFHGTLTVPIQKLLTNPGLASWITECDWLMYQKMIAFVAPLTTQVVPKAVLDAFSSISKRLTSHIADTFKSQPTHVSMAKLVPAHIFCHLLSHMLDVNQSANAAAAWLCHPDNRNQMWADFVSLIDPKEMISKANIPSCAEKTTEHVLKHDIRALLTPLDNVTHAQPKPFFNQPDDFDGLESRNFMVEPTEGDEYTNFPDRWISFILNLPDAFPTHQAQCIVDKVGKLWDCILHRLTLGGAQSFSAWWMTKVFFYEMMLWQAEKGGFMNSTPSSIKNLFPGSGNTGNGSLADGQFGNLKSFGGDTSFNSEYRPSDSIPRTAPPPPTSAVSQFGLSREESTESAARNSNTKHFNGANKSTIETNGKVMEHGPPNNDDSAIDLDDDSVLMAVGKYGDMMVSDPADAEGDVVVI